MGMVVCVRMAARMPMRVVMATISLVVAGFRRRRARFVVLHSPIILYLAVLKPQSAQRRMIVGPASQRPQVFALGIRDRQIIDTGDAQPHQALFVKFPILVAVTAKPLTTRIMPLIGKSYRDPVPGECPQLLDQAVVELARPFAHQECLDGVAALQEPDSIAPAAVGRIGWRHSSGIARIPRVFGNTHLLRG